MNDSFDFENKKHKNVGAIIAAIIIILAVIAFAALVLYSEYPFNSTKTVFSDTKQYADSSENANEFSKIYADNCDAIVVVNVYAEVDGETVEYATGSGFFISESGYILTNSHVVSSASRVTVTTYSGEVLEAKVVGFDERTEVGVIKTVKNGSFKTVNIGNSDNIAVGEYAIAIGSPLGYNYSLSVGVVSGVERNVNSNNYRYSMLQIDTAVNSGNSGCPLFNISGEVIGIVTMKNVSSSLYGEVEGMGFAIPINIAGNVAQQIIENGKVKRAAIQATIQNRVENGKIVGVYVYSVIEGGAADTAGLKANDRIISFNDVNISSIADLTEQLDKLNVGEAVDIVIERDGEAMTLTVTLGEL